MFELPFRMQSVLVSALRGCDTMRKEDPSKHITRALRAVLMHDADPTNSFMRSGDAPSNHVNDFLADLDVYPVHFVLHLAHAAEIVGYKHPNNLVREFWLKFYRGVIRAMHVNPETEEQLDVRLGFTPSEKDGVPDSKHAWDAGTGTSHGVKKDA
jgi:hypothetical protein